MEQQMNASNTAQQSVAPLMCRANCGFYGNQQCENYCSKCFKEQIRRQQDSSTAAPNMHTPSTPTSSSIVVQPPTPTMTTVESPVQHATITNAPKPCAPPTTQVQSSCSSDSTQSSSEAISIPLSLSAASSASDLLSSSPSTPGSVTKAKNRCHTCKRKVGLTGFDCRCGGKFCSEHRYSDAHSCSFDYKQHGQDLLRKANPGCVTNKIDKL